ncbi:hypothetical protein [Streptomyces africanus]|uniref:hypothetical protein n=1 Tax=Streptomyces africanus TaxID=231024 RepID=UPI000A369EA8|nr:hypothetical protein [Streptomyces africanus]
MAATIALPATVEIADRAAEIHAAWTADPDLPAVAGSMADAVRVLAVRAAVHEATGDERAAALAAPVAVELSAMLVERQFPQVHDVMKRTGHRFIAGEAGTRWQPGDYAHQAYVGAFGPVGGRHWTV